MCRNPIVPHSRPSLRPFERPNRFDRQVACWMRAFSRESSHGIFYTLKTSADAVIATRMLRQVSKVVLVSKRSLRVLLTNHQLGDPGGTEVNIRDWAIGLLRRGHRPVAYAPVLGRTADVLRAR